MDKYEKELWDKGIKYIAGTDEAGRGALAGPIFVAAVIFRPYYSNPKIKDSKKITPLTRNELSRIIKNDALCYSIVSISVSEIENLNPKQASRLGMLRAINELKIKPSFLLTDFEKVDIEIDQLNLIKGDNKSISIAAASILAKVARDEEMIKLDKKYPNYGLDKHKGYGTILHRKNLEIYGRSKIHRKTFNFKVK